MGLGAGVRGRGRPALSFEIETVSFEIEIK